MFKLYHKDLTNEICESRPFQNCNSLVESPDNIIVNNFLLTGKVLVEELNSFICKLC